MSNVAQNSSENMSKHLKCIICFICVLAPGIILLHFYKPTFHDSFEFVNDTTSNLKSFSLAFNTNSNSKLPILCIVARTYGPQIRFFPVLALSLHDTGLGNIRIYL